MLLSVLSGAQLDIGQRGDKGAEESQGELWSHHELNEHIILTLYTSKAIVCLKLTGIKVRLNFRRMNFVKVKRTLCTSYRLCFDIQVANNTHANRENYNNTISGAFVLYRITVSLSKIRRSP